jgi:hypothetical protein
VQFHKLPILAVVAFACVSLTSFPAPCQVLKKWKDRGETPLTASPASRRALNPRLVEPTKRDTLTRPTSSADRKRGRRGTSVGKLALGAT